MADARCSDHEVRCYEDALGFIAQIRDARESAPRAISSIHYTHKSYSTVHPIRVILALTH
jgi:hypothetical protein